MMKHSKSEQKKIVAQIMVLIELAMVSREEIHIHVEYQPHVEWVGIDVMDKDHNYKSGNWAEELLISKYIKLNEKDALNQLLKIEDVIINLIGEVKEVNEIIGEVA